MKIYILGKIGKLTKDEWWQRHNAAIEVEKDAHEPINYGGGSMISYEDPVSELINEISFLIQSDAVWLFPDFNDCEDARILLAMAIRLQLPIHPANGCIVPSRISFSINI